jgi:hypothetical protein
MDNSEKIVKELEEYRTAIEQTKQNMARDEGVLQGLVKQLKEITGTDDLELSKQKLEEWKKEKENLKRN